jgi:hypothetical protein
MHTIQVQTAIEDNFEQKEVLFENDTPEMLDIDMSEPGELQPYPRYPQADKPEIPVKDTFFSEWASWRQFFSLLLKTGGWTAAVLLSFRFVIIPLLSAGNSPVALILAMAVSIFIVLCAIGALVREFKR